MRTSLYSWHSFILDIPLFSTILYPRLSFISNISPSSISCILLSRLCCTSNASSFSRNAKRWHEWRWQNNGKGWKQMRDTIYRYYFHPFKRTRKDYSKKDWERTYFISILHVLVKVAGANQNDVPSLYKIIRVLYFSIPPLNWSSALKVKWKKDGIWDNSSLEKGSYIK